ncbi:glycosyltransferase [uncultured Celeribacter sp.]|uniref:glycosyltransferase n=1 Tax=uncultured Celeribacter sp. TaxID=1303376 RepID=UPI002AA8C18E|nr:glycosyltransferase [uncultured Celeribacter sp.]
MGSVFRLIYLKRFFRAIREEGVGTALRKAVFWTKFFLGGAAPSGFIARRYGVSSGYYLGGIWRDLAERQSFDASRNFKPKTPKVVVIGDLNLPQCKKYRVAQLSELFEIKGWQFDYSSIGDAPRAAELLQDATHLILYRVLMGKALSEVLYEARRLGIPVLYDIDDPLFSISAYATYENMKALPERLAVHFMDEAPKYALAMNACDMVSVSTPRLAEFARRYVMRPVVVRRNFADRSTLAACPAPESTPAEAGVFRMGFATGSQGHEMDLAVVADALAEFLSRAPGRKLMLIGQVNQKFIPEDLLPYCEFEPFTDYETYLAVLAKCDVVLLPLTDDMFNQSKSAVRALDAAAVARPVIASDVSDQKHFVLDGKTGILVSQGQSWLTALEQMAKDPTFCNAMGRAARANLTENWAAMDREPVAGADFWDFFS